MCYSYLLDSIIERNDSLNFLRMNDWQFPMSKVAHDTITVFSDNTQRDILNRLNDIYLDGIGYSDVVGIIVFPLIIALFAFSFPFIFDRINQINDKYQSKLLSNLFSSSWLYRLFWKTSSCCITYVIIYGGCSLFFKESFLVQYTIFWNSFSLFIASIYALLVWSFAKRSIKYNNPERLLEILDARYKYEQRVAKLSKWWMGLKITFRYYLHRKDTEGNTIMKSTEKMVSNWKEKAPNENYINRLYEVARYSIKHDDFGLFQNILGRLDTTIEREKNSISTWNFKKDADDVIKESAIHYLTMAFFKDLMLDFTPFSRGYMSNETVVFKMVGAFNRTMYLAHNDALYLATCFRRMIDKNNVSLIFKYLDYTNYYFKYLLKLPQIHYIKGGQVIYRNIVEKKSYESWTNLAVFHYISMAYGFEKEKYYLLDILLNYKRTYFPSLYPIEGANILIIYAQSLKQYISSVLSEQLCDKNTDIVQLLTRYTSALLLLMSKNDSTNYFVSKPVTAEYIKAIEERRDNLKEAAESIKQHKKITELYPHIKNVDFDSLLENCIQQMKSINDMPILKEPESVIRKKVGCNIVKKIYKLFSGNSTNSVSVKDLYCMSLNNVIIDDFKNRFTQFERDALRYIPKGLFVEDARNKNEEELVNPCQLLVHKLMFLDTNLYSNGRNIYYDFVELISTRFVYLALCAFCKMNIQELILKVSDFDLFFEKFTHGKKENYVLIGISTPFDAILNTTRVGNEVFYRETVPYIEIDAVGRYDLLKDLEQFNFFENSLLIVAKSDLPSIVNSTNENISFDFKEECDKSKMEMNVRTTVDIHKKVLFNKMANIAVVKIKPMSL